MAISLTQARPARQARLAPYPRPYGFRLKALQYPLPHPIMVAIERPVGRP